MSSESKQTNKERNRLLSKYTKIQLESEGMRTKTTEMNKHVNLVSFVCPLNMNINLSKKAYQYHPENHYIKSI